MSTARTVTPEQAEKRRAKESKARRKLERRRAFTLPPSLPEIMRAWQERPGGQPLHTYAQQMTSQHGEDGITVEVFRRIGVAHATAVEIGCGANGGNAGILVAGLGFRGLFLDGNEELVRECRRVYAAFPVEVRQTWIERETIADVLAGAGFGSDLDYLGIDLDGVDYWIWEALTVRPRLLIVEY